MTLAETRAGRVTPCRVTRARWLLSVAWQRAGRVTQGQVILSQQLVG